MVLLKVAISEQNYGIVWRNPSGLCCYGVWNGCILETSGWWCCWLWTIILPPPTWPRETPNWDIPPPPGRRGVACWMVSGMVLLLPCNNRIHPTSQQRQMLSWDIHPTGQGEGSLAAHPPGMGSSHTRLHPHGLAGERKKNHGSFHGVRNEPSPCLSCHYWLLRQSSRQSSVNWYWLRLFCC